jgi:hypothetical protein
MKILLVWQFEDCEFALFKNFILKKKLRENSKQISQPEPEAGENDHFFYYPVEYDYENSMNQTIGSQLSSPQKTFSEDGQFYEYPVEYDYEYSINQSPRSQPSNPNDSLSELSSSEFKFHCQVSEMKLVLKMISHIITLMSI